MLQCSYCYDKHQRTQLSGDQLSCLGTNSVSSWLTAVPNFLSVQLQQHGCTTQKLSGTGNLMTTKFKKHITRSPDSDDLMIRFLNFIVVRCPVLDNFCVVQPCCCSCTDKGFCMAVRQGLTELIAQLVSMLTILCDALTMGIGIKLCIYKRRSENSVRSPINTKSHMAVHACRPNLCLLTCKHTSLNARVQQA